MIQFYLHSLFPFSLHTPAHKTFGLNSRFSINTNRMTLYPIFSIPAPQKIHCWMEKESRKSSNLICMLLLFLRSNGKRGENEEKPFLAVKWGIGKWKNKKPIVAGFCPIWMHSWMFWTLQGRQETVNVLNCLFHLFVHYRCHRLTNCMR